MRQLAQRAHFLHIVGRKAAVQAAVIAQHGIYQYQGILLREILDELPGDFNLPDRAEKAGADAVKMHADALPMGNEGLHFLRHVAHDIAVKSAGVGGQDGGRQGDGFHARSGQDGQRHAQRALAQAGQIVDQRRALHAGIVYRLHKGVLLTVGKMRRPRTPTVIVYDGICEKRKNFL